MNEHNYWGKLIRGIVCVVILMALQGQDIKLTSNSVSASDLENQVPSEAGDYVPGEVLIGFREEVTLFQNNGRLRATESLLQTEITKLGISNANILFDSPDIDRALLPQVLQNVYKFTFPENQDVLSVVASLKELPNVEFVEPNYIYHLDSTTSLPSLNIPPNDEYYNKQWGLDTIHAEQAWQITTGDPNVKIAILDSGIDMNHPDLSAKIMGGYDYANNDEIPDDELGHGTHVAGIAAGIGDNAQGIAGVAWNCPIVPFKIGVSKPSGDLIADAIIHATTDEKIWVINISVKVSHNSYLQRAIIEHAYKKGITVVVAAGNDHTSNPTYPAAYKNTISVSAINQKQRLAGFSNYGASVALTAPGEAIWSTMPTYPVIYTRFPYNLVYSKNYTKMDGTSMAAPFVSGVAALVYSALPAELRTHGPATADLVRRILEQTAVNLKPNEWNQYYGWGRVDAYQAVLNAANPPRLDFYAPLYYGDGADHRAWMTLRIRDMETQKLLYEGRVAQQSEGHPFDPPKLYGVPTGNYDVIIKGPASITKRITNVQLTANSTAYVDFTEGGEPLYREYGGDFNKDDVINSADYDYLISKYWTDDWLADLSGDGVVKAVDLIVLLNNWEDNNVGDDYGNTADAIANQTYKAKALTGAASLNISPNTGTYYVGQEFEAKVQIDTAGKTINGADLVLRYDPIALKVVEITSGTVLPENAKQEVVWSNGEIIIGSHESTGGSFSGIGTVATVRFRVLAGETTTTLRVRFRPTDTTDSNITEVDTQQDLLGAVNHGTFTLSGTPTRAALNGVFNKASGDYLTEMENLIVFRPDLVSRILVEEVAFEAYYDSEWHPIGVDYSYYNNWRTYWHTEMVTDQIISLRANVLDLNGTTTAFTVDNLYLDRIAPATTLTAPPFLPDSGEFIVSWQGQDNLTGVASYDVQYKDGEDSSWIEWKSATTSTSASFTGESGHNYYFQARAHDVAGNEEAFSEEVVVLGDPPTVYLPFVMRN